MGFSCGVELKRYSKKDPHRRVYLYYFGNPGDALDNLIVKYAEPGDEEIEYYSPILDETWETEHRYELKHALNQAYEFKLTKECLQKIASKLRPVYNIINKYSNRVIHQLVEYLEDGTREELPSEFLLEDLSKLKDLLYDIGAETDEYPPEIFSVMNVYDGISSLSLLDDDFFEEEELIYYRSF